MLEHHGTETPTLVVVPDDECDLGLTHKLGDRPAGRACCGAGEGIVGLPGKTVVAGHRDELAVHEGDERQPVLIVDGYEVPDLLVADLLTRSEETEIHRFPRKPRPEGAQQRAVDGPNGASRAERPSDSSTSHSSSPG